MALSSTQKYCVINYLGWAAKTLQVGSTHYSKTIDDRLSTLPAEAEPKVLEYLDQMEKIRGQIEEAQCRLSASQIGDIRTNEFEIEKLRAQESYWLRRLSEWVDIPIVRSSGRNMGLTV